MDVFQDKVAIVTGAASGIGLALCRELGRRGASVVMCDVNAGRLAEAAKAVADAIARAVRRLSRETVLVGLAVFRPLGYRDSSRSAISPTVEGRRSFPSRRRIC